MRCFFDSVLNLALIQLIPTSVLLCTTTIEVQYQKYENRSGSDQIMLKCQLSAVLFPTKMIIEIVR